MLSVPVTLCVQFYVMVLGGFCGQHRTDVIVIDGNLTALRYINQVLRPVLLPFLQHQPRLLFQQDNARPHTARMVHQCLQCSRDLSPIEHLWDHLGQRIRRRPNPPMNRDRLVQALRQEWRVIPDAVIGRLTTSFRCRVHFCILAHGGQTRY